VLRLAAVALVVGAGSLGPSGANARPLAWHYQQCGYLRAHGVNNELESGGNPRPASCRTSRRVLAAYLRHPRTRISGWRCDGGGSNGAVLAECRRAGYFIAVYDARAGE